MSRQGQSKSIKAAKWERLEPGVYRFLCMYNNDIWLIWIERGCDKHALYPHWYWRVCLNEDAYWIGFDYSLREAKANAMKLFEEQRSAAPTIPEWAKLKTYEEVMKEQ